MKMRRFTISYTQTALACARRSEQASVAFRRQPFSYFVDLGACRRFGPGAPDNASILLQSMKARSYSTATKTNRKNYYKILAVSSKATQSQIKDAYYKQSMKHHPDKHKGSEEAHDTFQEITEAYSILGNHDLRKQYDRGLIVSGEISLDPAPPKPSGSIYDFDEWTKQHYFEALKRKQRSMRERADEERERNSQKLQVGSQRWVILSVFCLTVVVVLVLERRVKNTREEITEWE